MHRKLRGIGQRKPVVHQRENTLLVLSTVPSPKNDSLFLFDIEYNGSLGIEVEAFMVLNSLRAAIDNRKVRFKVLQLGRGGRSDEHVGYKMLLPCHLMHKSNLLARIFIGSTITIEDVDSLASVEVLNGLIIQLVEHFRLGWHVDIVPVNVLCGLAAFILDNKPVLGRAASVLSGINSESITVFCFGNLAFIVSLFMLEEFLVGQVAVNSGWSGDTESVNSNCLASIGSDNVLGYFVSLTGFYCLGEVSLEDRSTVGLSTSLNL